MRWNELRQNTGEFEGNSCDMTASKRQCQTRRDFMRQTESGMISHNTWSLLVPQTDRKLHSTNDIEKSKDETATLSHSPNESQKISFNDNQKRKTEGGAPSHATNC